MRKHPNYHEQLKTLDEEVLRNDRLKAVTELEQKYEKTKNEKTIKELNQASEIKTLRIEFFYLVSSWRCLSSLLCFLHSDRKL